MTPHKLICSAAFAMILGHAAIADEAASAPDRHLAAAMDLLDSNGSLKSVSSMLDAMAPLQAREIRKQRPDIDDATLASLQKAVKDEIIAREGEYKLILAQIYERHFTEEELRTLTSFYRSDVGKKYVGSIPDLIKEATPAAALWAQGVVADVVKRVLDRVKAQGDHA